MQYRIKETKRRVNGAVFHMAVGLLYSDAGKHLGSVEAWSTAGALAALKDLANRINKGV